MAARHVLCGALLFVFASANELISSLPIVNCYGGAPGAYTNGAISLTVEQTVWNVDGQVKFTTRGYSYNGQSLMPGPIIRVMPGTTCAVTVTNALPTASQAQCTRDMSEWVPGTPGSWMCPDVTTFYVQGLHVSPNQDTPLVDISPGDSKTYTYTIPGNHLMGTHWYHDNRHGSAALHVGGGLHGMLQVMPSSALPADVAALYDDGNTYLYNMVLSHIHFGDGDPLQGEMSHWSYPELWELYGKQSMSPAATVYTPQPNFYAVNGQYQPIVEISPTMVGLFRIAHAATNRNLVLKLGTTGVCRMRLLARDGVFQKSSTHYPIITRMVFVPGTRADIGIQCNPPAATVFPLDIPVYADSTDIGPLGGNAHSQDVVFIIRIVSYADNTQNPQILSLPTSMVPLPSYLNDLSTATVVWQKVVDTTNGTLNGGYWPGLSSNQQFVYTLCLGSVHEIWLASFDYANDAEGNLNPALDSPSTNTPARRLARGKVVTPYNMSYNANAGVSTYFQQTNHFQIIKMMEVPAVEPDFVIPGEWRDTVPQLTNGTVIRVSPDSFTGSALMGTQLLQHQDQGIMGLYTIQTC